MLKAHRIVSLNSRLESYKEEEVRSFDSTREMWMHGLFSDSLGGENGSLGKEIRTLANEG